MSIRFGNLIIVAVSLAAFACAGCTPNLPPPTDAKEARAALETALDTWKRGEAPETLKERTPPIQFADLNWEKGARLLKYDITNEEPRGLSMRVTVKLSLQGKDGQRREATAIYTAETQPRIVIVPEF